PGDADSGMLEDLCLRTVATNPVMPCVEQFMTCIASKVTWGVSESRADSTGVYRHPNNVNKARAKAFLAANESDFPSVGVAAQSGVWSFDHECLQDLREFLLQFQLR